MCRLVAVKVHVDVTPRCTLNVRARSVQGKGDELRRTLQQQPRQRETGGEQRAGVSFAPVLDEKERKEAADQLSPLNLQRKKTSSDFFG